MITPRSVPRPCCAKAKRAETKRIRLMNKLRCRRLAAGFMVKLRLQKKVAGFSRPSLVVEPLARLFSDNRKFAAQDWLRQANAERYSRAQTSSGIRRALCALRRPGREHSQQRVRSIDERDRREPRRIGPLCTRDDDRIAYLEVTDGDRRHTIKHVLNVEVTATGSRPSAGATG